MEAIRRRNGQPTTAPCACDFHRSIWPVLLSLAALLGQQSLAEQRGPAWSVHVIDSGLSGGDGVRLLDVDDDGDLDLAVGWEQSGVARLYLNPGHVPEVRGKWSAIDCGPAPHVEDAMPADIDGDGRIDVVSCTEGGNRRVLVHFAPTEGDYTDSAAWTTVEFPESLAGDRKWMFAIALDIDLDGHLDIVAGGKSPDAKVAWFEAPATDKRVLSQWGYHEMSNAGWIMSLIPHDMDGDGDPDIVVSDRRSEGGLMGARWLENPAPGGDPTGPWPNHFIGDVGDHTDFMALADMDGDGDLDAIVPAKDPDRIDWHERLDAGGTHWMEHEIAFPPHMGKAKGVKIGDINLDGQLDLVLSCASAKNPLSGLVWMEYASSAFDVTWIDHEISGPAGSKFDRIELVDLDGDGDLDVLTTEENDGPASLGMGVIWYENPTIVSFAAVGRKHKLSETIPDEFPAATVAQAAADNSPLPQGAKGVAFSHYEEYLLLGRTWICQFAQGSGREAKDLRHGLHSSRRSGQDGPGAESRP